MFPSPRYEPGETVLNVRWIAGHPDQEYEPWRQLVLTETLPTTGTGRGPADLRARQITEALRVLEGQHLLQLPRQMPSGQRRQYDPGKNGTNWHLLSEASTAEERLGYRIPGDPRRCLRISRHFFTNLWVFALTDAEIAAYLAIAALRTLFPARHDERGVYLLADTREAQFHLTRTTWRATEPLHRFRLIDRARDPKRSFRTGKVGDRETRWKNRQVMPALFKINDNALKRLALDTIHQILTHPSPEDDLRRERGQEAIDDEGAGTPPRIVDQFGRLLP